MLWAVVNFSRVERNLAQLLPPLQIRTHLYSSVPEGLADICIGSLGAAGFERVVGLQGVC